MRPHTAVLLEWIWCPIINLLSSILRLREASKIELWTTYLLSEFQGHDSYHRFFLTPLAHGRNLTLLRYPQCTRLVQVGLPNRLRGEIWVTLWGSLFLRYAHPGYYEQILQEHKGRASTSTEDIEKDLHRSLPEYVGYQSEEGIGALCQVLQAYSFMNPELGYCQVCRQSFCQFHRFHRGSTGYEHPCRCDLDVSLPIRCSFSCWLSTLVICPKSRRFGCWRSFVNCGRLLPGYYACSLIVNAVVTGLISLRILKVYWEVTKPTFENQTSSVGGTNAKLRSIIFIIIESGIAMFAIQLIWVVLTKSLPFSSLLILSISSVSTKCLMWLSDQSFLHFTLLKLFVGNNTHHHPPASVNGIVLPWWEIHGGNCCELALCLL